MNDMGSSPHMGLKSFETSEVSATYTDEIEPTYTLVMS